MKLFLWTNKLLFLITQFFFASVCHHELYWPKFKQIWQELLRINKCVQHFSKALMSTFVIVWVGHFHGFLIVPSRAFHGPLELWSPMKYMLGCNCLSGVMKCVGLKYNYLTFMTHENPYSWLCKLFMVHEKNW